MKVTTGKAHTSKHHNPKERKAVKKAEGIRMHVQQLDDGSFMTETHHPPKKSGKGADMAMYQPPATASHADLAGVHGHLDQTFAPPTPGAGTKAPDDEAAEGEKA